MRSNKHKTRFLLRRSLFIAVIVFLAAFYTMPFWGLSHIPGRSELSGQGPAQEMMARQFTQTISSGVMTDPLPLELMVILYGGLGFLTAMTLMQHLFSRRQSMLHAALPDTRRADFLRRCAAYAALCLAPIVLNFLLYLLVVAAKGMLAYVAWDVLLPKFGVLLLINLYGFAMGMLSSVLTGTYWAALLAGAVLIVGMEALSALWYWLGCRYLHTLIKRSFTHALLHLSPAYSLYKGLYKPAEFVWFPGVAAILLALGLSFFLYRIRKTERAEHTLAFAPLQGILGFALPLLGGTFLGVVVMLSFETEISLAAGMAAGAVLTFWVCRIVFNQRLCGILRQWYLPAAASAMLVLGVVALHTDAIGYDRFLPDRQDLTAISYHPLNFHYGETITLTSAEALDAAYAWCTLMHDEVNSYEDGLTRGSTAYNVSDVEITYHMGDRMVYRHYPNYAIRTDAQESLKRIIESDDYRQSLIREYGLDTHSVTRLYASERLSIMRQDIFYDAFGTPALYRDYTRSEDGPMLDELLSALKQDILDRTFEEMQKLEILNVTLGIESSGASDARYVDLSIYPGDTNFLKALFGEKTEAVIDYVTGGYAGGEDFAVLKVDFAQSRAEVRASRSNLRDIVQSVTPAASPEEAIAWVRQAQSTSALNYYHMPCIDDAAYSRLYIYQLSEVETLANVSGYDVPEDKKTLYLEPEIPSMAVMDWPAER